MRFSSAAKSLEDFLIGTQSFEEFFNFRLFLREHTNSGENGYAGYFFKRARFYQYFVPLSQSILSGIGAFLATQVTEPKDALSVVGVLALKKIIYSRSRRAYKNLSKTFRNFSRLDYYYVCWDEIRKIEEGNEKNKDFR
ncbi:hypothetical protein D6829_01540 [Candidatus Pacearchaeota archaeon]|nr:MAG: hypothetical protein D6829_01540 [Candidatus Pacearchaeota archaeon]